MAELLKKAPYLAKTHEIYTYFSVRERRREYALSRMKAELDFAAQMEYAMKLMEVNFKNIKGNTAH